MKDPAENAVVREAARVMTICNACRYCEGHCATFRAMTMRRAFAGADLDYLANLCHDCQACFHGCQYTPPHQFNVNVPKTLAALRADSYRRYAWPRFVSRLFERNGMVVSIAIAASLALVLLLVFLYRSPGALTSIHSGPGAFYAVVGHGVMAGVAGVTFGFSMLALLLGFLGFWRATMADSASIPGVGAWMKALRYAATLKYLGGEQGQGCHTADERLSHRRRYFHQITMWGFMLCFVSTVAAGIYHYGLGMAAPYSYSSIPVLSGSVGGAGLLIGPAGLSWLKARSDPRPVDSFRLGMDYALLASLFLVALTGMLLLALRETSAMGILLVVHLGFVFAFFLTLPYGKFVHGVYRFAALLRFAADSVNSQAP